MNKLFYLVLFLMIIPGALSIGTMTRTMPATATAGQTFSVVYTVSGVSGNYIVSVSDVVTGNCVPTGQHQFFIADDYTYKKTETFTYMAPASGSCVFHGDYKFGEDATTLMSDSTITVSGSGCTFVGCTEWGQCDVTTHKQGRTCTDSCGNTNQESQTCTVDPCAGLTMCVDGICRTSCVGVCQTGLKLCSDGSCKADCVIPPDCTAVTCGNWGICIASGQSYLQSRYCTDSCGNTNQETVTKTAAECTPNECAVGQGRCDDGKCATTCGSGGTGGTFDITGWFKEETIFAGVANWMVLVGGLVGLIILTRLIK
jgi:hypothetical protein